MNHIRDFDAKVGSKCRSEPNIKKWNDSGKISCLVGFVMFGSYFMFGDLLVTCFRYHISFSFTFLLY